MTDAKVKGKCGHCHIKRGDNTKRHTEDTLWPRRQRSELLQVEEYVGCKMLKSQRGLLPCRMQGQYGPCQRLDSKLLNSRTAFLLF